MRIEKNYYSEQEKEFDAFDKAAAKERASLSPAELEQRREMADAATDFFWESYLEYQLHTGYIINPARHSAFMKIANTALQYAKNSSYDIEISDEPPKGIIKLTSAVFMDPYKESALPELFSLCSDYCITPTKNGTVMIILEYDIYDEFPHD